MRKRRACAACQHLRTKCVENCLLAPHFPAADMDRFHRVLRVFGIRAAKRILQGAPAEDRKRVADCMAEEAYWRLKEPTKGYTALVESLKEELNSIRREIAEIMKWPDSKYLSDGASEVEKQGYK